jgi:hypothetical protein
MRVARCLPQPLLLPTVPRNSGEPAVDEATGRAALEVARVWPAEADLGTPTGRLGGQRKARGPLDAGDGIGSHLSQTGHEPARGGARNPSIFTAWERDQRPRSSVVRGHHVSAHAPRVSCIWWR